MMMCIYTWGMLAHGHCYDVSLNCLVWFRLISTCLLPSTLSHTEADFTQKFSSGRGFFFNARLWFLYQLWADGREGETGRKKEKKQERKKESWHTMIHVSPLYKIKVLHLFEPKNKCTQKTHILRLAKNPPLFNIWCFVRGATLLRCLSLLSQLISGTSGPVGVS